MNKDRNERWIAWIGAYAVSSNLGNPLLKRDEWRFKAAIQRKEFEYCFWGMDKEDINYILEGLSALDINLVESVETTDRRRLAKFLINGPITQRITNVKRLGDTISCETVIEWMENYPFLKQEVSLLLSLFDKNGISIDGMNIKDYKKKTSNKYFTEEERKEARRKSRDKYQKKKNLRNQYSWVQTIKSADVEQFKYLDTDFDISRYTRQTDEDY